MTKQKVIDIIPPLSYPYMVRNAHANHVQQSHVGSKIINVRSNYLIKPVDTLDNKDYI